MPRRLTPEAVELDLWIDNNQPLYRQKQAIRKNLTRFVCKRTFTKTGAEKGFSHVVNAAMKSYHKEFIGRGPMPRGLWMSARKEVNKELTSEYLRDLNSCVRDKMCGDLSDEIVKMLKSAKCSPGGELSGARKRRRR